MNKEVKKVFSDIFNEISRYQSSVTAILSSYRQDMNRARDRCSKYKDETAELGKERTGLISAARAKVAAADKDLSDALKLLYVPKLKEALSDYICKRANVEYTALLRDYKDFGIELSRAELDALILQADGNYSALRMLQRVAEKSGYRLTVPTVEEYQKDIVGIENVARVPVMWTDNNYIHEAVDVFTDRPVFRDDGSVAYSAGRPDSVSLLTSSAGLNMVYKSLQETGERWAKSFVPSICEYQPVKNTDGDTITPEMQRAAAVEASATRIGVCGQEGETMAAAMGAVRVAENAKAAAVLERYTG